ncbi:hypothetical protein WJX77_007669 [Trebouxia sp. C0004]
MQIASTAASIRWKTDFDKFVIISNFERRHWSKHSQADEDGWDIYWASVITIKQIFSPENTVRLEPHQIINHFPNHYELTRKDLMVKNVKRYVKQQKKDVLLESTPEFIPVTYILPQDYSLFVEEFRKVPVPWIMKPIAKAQGRGIFLINKLSQVKKWASSNVPAAMRQQTENYVVSRYIEDPLLIGGKKFDLRMYVVVLNYKPLQVYMSQLGFARFCNIKYSSEVAEMDNQFVHLTNVAIQKHGDEYNFRHGNKWPLTDLRLYLEATRGHAATSELFESIKSVIICSLKACQNVMINDRHCFELYGYDVIIDQSLKPWLIEVNASPSLSATTHSDRLLKCKVIHDTLQLVTPPDWDTGTDSPIPNSNQDAQPARCLPRTVGSMQLLFDETSELEEGRARRDALLSTESVKRGRRKTMIDSVLLRPTSAYA